MKYLRRSFIASLFAAPLFGKSKVNLDKLVNNYQRVFESVTYVGDTVIYERKTWDAVREAFTEIVKVCKGGAQAMSDDAAVMYNGPKHPFTPQTVGTLIICKICGMVQGTGLYGGPQHIFATDEAMTDKTNAEIAQGIMTLRRITAALDAKDAAGLRPANEGAK